MVCGPEIMMRFVVRRSRRGEWRAAIHVSLERNMQCGVALCGHCQLGPLLLCRDGPVLPHDRVAALLEPGSSEPMARKPRLAVWKFASCDGCQLTLLDCEDELLQIAGEVEIAYFLEATRGSVAGPTTSRWSRARSRRRTTPSASSEVRRASRALVTIGACATSGGIQALRNFADVDDFLSIVYATPSYVSTLATSTPISAHVPVDFELQGCPIDKRQLLEVLSAFLNRREPRISAQSVCVECKRRGNVCVMVAHGTPCLGPVTHAGCGAICPSYDRGCYGCFGPKETPNTASLASWWEELGVHRTGAAPRLPHVQRVREPFQQESDAHDPAR